MCGTVFVILSISCVFMDAHFKNTSLQSLVSFYTKPYDLH